jgi:hypothetical protein
VWLGNVQCFGGNTFMQNVRIFLNYAAFTQKTVLVTTAHMCMIVMQVIIYMFLKIKYEESAGFAFST